MPLWFFVQFRSHTPLRTMNQKVKVKAMRTDLDWRTFEIFSVLFHAISAVELVGFVEEDFLARFAARKSNAGQGLGFGRILTYLDNTWFSTESSNCGLLSRLSCTRWSSTCWGLVMMLFWPLLNAFELLMDSCWHEEDSDGEEEATDDIRGRRHGCLRMFKVRMTCQPLQVETKDVFWDLGLADLSGTA